MVPGYAVPTYVQDTTGMQRMRAPRVPASIRVSVLRACGAAQLLCAIVTTVAAITTTVPEMKFPCGMAAAVCYVVFYHYEQLISIRALPNVAYGGEIGTEIAIDAVRYNDLVVTLPSLSIQLHVLHDGHWHMFSPSISALLMTASVLLIAFVRIGTDELVPGTPTKKDIMIRIVGWIMFILGSCMPGVVMINIFTDVPIKFKDEWMYAYSIPYLAYGLVASAGIAWRQLFVQEYSQYPEYLSLVKDALFAGLDTWCKAMFSLYIASKALGVDKTVFNI
jgi:hypothetical protein